MAEDMLVEVLADAEKKMARAVEVLEHDLTTIRTGRASPALVDRLHVDYYGSETPLNQIAGINAPEPRLLVIQPWDKSSIPAIEKAILKSELGLNPVQRRHRDPHRLAPAHRGAPEDLVKVVHRRVEEGRVAVRNVRREAHDDLRELRKENMATEDDLKQGEQRLQRLTDRYIADADRVGQRKEAEVLEV